MICDHPDHNDQETCEDRAVGCSSDCPCCIPTWTDDTYRYWSNVPNPTENMPVMVEFFDGQMAWEMGKEEITDPGEISSSEALTSLGG
jgi:hypothetical protein